MKILSIDVGMKHLAFCLFDIQEAGTFKIQLWDVVNLCSEENEKMCMGKTKKNICCNKLAKFHKNNEFFCKTHAKNNKYLVPTNDLKPVKIRKLNIKPLKKLIEKYEIKVDLKKPLKKDYLNIFLEHVDKNYYSFIEKIKANSLNLVTLGRNMKTHFTKILDGVELQCVIVENQIGPLALRMKTLQGMIMQHFIERNCSIIEEISPMNKLKDYTTKKTNYNERKKLGIEITLKKLEEINEISTWQTHFVKHKKKDDLADSFLQGLWYINNSGLMKL
tara:strand:- start:1165 stop:1992 length:828 start_codon:yes stop_codon:yes gene_type:complete